MNTNEMYEFPLQVLANKHLCMVPSLFFIGQIFQTTSNGSSIKTNMFACYNNCFKFSGAWGTSQTLLKGGT
jgi:hypothetical protein